MNEWTIKTILLGYDGSEGAERAAEVATTLARQSQARIVVVTTFHWAYSLDAMGERADQIAKEAQSTAELLVSRLEAAGLEAAAEVKDGPAGEVLLKEAEAQGADLIVIGRRGQGVVASLLLGSVSEYVVRRAKVPVLVAH